MGKPSDGMQASAFNGRIVLRDNGREAISMMRQSIVAEGSFQRWD